MVRRLITSLTVWICLLGLIQPALACASPADCCPKGSAGGIEQSSVPGANAVDGCCCVQQARASSPWVAAQPLKAPDHRASPPASPGVEFDVLVSQRAATQAALLVRADYRSNHSLTYLQTARLRL